MGTIADAFGEAFKDLVGGLPYDPDKAVIRALGGTIEAAIDAAIAGSGGTADVRLEGLRRRLLLAVPQRVVYIGDSIMAFNILNSDATGAYLFQSAVGEVEWAAALDRRFDVSVWNDVNNVPGGYNTGANLGIAGNVSSQVLTRFPFAVAQNPDLIILAVGINDITTGVSQAAIMANINAMVALAQAAGIPMVIGNIRPVTSAYIANGDAKLTTLTNTNAAIAALCTADPLLTLWDVYSVYNDPGSPNRPRSGYTFDGRHPAPLGAAYAGIALKTVLSSVLAPYSAFKHIDVGNFARNGGKFTGTGGTKGARVTGSVADSWSASWISGSLCSAVGSLVSNPLTGGWTQRFVFTPSGSATEQFFFDSGAMATASLAGKWVETWMQVKLSPWAGFRNVHTTHAGRRAVLDVYDGSADRIPTDQGDITLLLKTHPWKMGSVETTVGQSLTAYIDGAAAGTGTLDIMGASIAEAGDPRPLRNFPAS